MAFCSLSFTCLDTGRWERKIQNVVVPNVGYCTHGVLLSAVLVVIVSSTCFICALFSEDLFSLTALIIWLLLVTAHANHGGLYLRRGSVATRLLGLPVRIPLGAWLSVPWVVNVVCCQVEVYGSVWWLVQRSPSQYDMSECVWLWSLDSEKAVAH
jgi:hypothetical protein